MSRLQGNDPILASLEPEMGVKCLDDFWFQRTSVDENIEKQLSSFNALDLNELICYRDFKGNLRRDPVGICVARLLNHQQHHQWTIVCCTDARSSVLSLSNSGSPNEDNCDHLF